MSYHITTCCMSQYNGNTSLVGLQSDPYYGESYEDYYPATAMF